MLVVSLCDYSGIMVKPWLNAGYLCIIVDIQHKEGWHREGNLIRVGSDINHFTMPENVHIAFGFPPCTDLANSGARWFKEKGFDRYKKAVDLVRKCWELISEANCYMLENPVGRLTKAWRKPDYKFDPCDYAETAEDLYTKKTCLWTSPNFVMPQKNRQPPILGSKMHYVPPGSNQKNIRSQTPQGFANAVFGANKL